jgi:quercetin dioxygenase-like cupin family protein
LAGTTTISIYEKGNAMPTLTTLHRAEFPDGYATVLALIDNASGAPRHTHPGLEVTYILEGEAKLLVDGRPDQTLKPGDRFEVPAGVPHSVEIVGDKPGRALAHYVVENDKPMVTWL